MNTSKLSTNMHLALSLLILLAMGLVGCAGIEVGAEDLNAPQATAGEVTGIEIGIEPTPMPETLTYTNDFYGFKFDYPETWTLTEEDHGVVLKKGTNRLGINFRWINENYNFGRTGVGAGDFIYDDKIMFIDQIIPAEVLLYELKTKAVFYGGTSVVEVGDIAFTLVLEDLETDYLDVDLTEEIMTEAKSIVESFKRIEATGTPPEGAPATTSGAPAVTNVVAWLGHIASLPDGSQYDDMVVLSPEGTGEFGLVGSTPEIEAEIQSLRDADGPNEYVHFWGSLSCGNIDDYNDCQLSVDHMQYGANYSEQEISDWFGTIKSTRFNDGQSYVFQLDGYFPMWYSIHASQSESLQSQIQHFLETGEVVEVSGKLMVGVPDVNGTRIEINNIQVRSMAGPRPDITDGTLYENEEYGFSFQYPSGMSVVEESNRILVNQDNVQLIIAYRRVEDDISISDVGQLTGQFHPYTEVLFLGQPVQPSLNIQDGLIKAVYLGGPGVELGEGTPLRFVISLVSTDGTWISNAQVDMMLQVIENLDLAK